MCKKVKMGRPKKSNESFNVERAKKYRAKNLDLIHTKDAVRKRNAREKLKNNKNAYEQYKRKVRERKSKTSKASASMETTPTLETTAQAPTQDTPSSSTQALSLNVTLARSVKKATQALPRSPRKRTTVIHKLVEGLPSGQRKNLDQKFRRKSGDVHADGRRPVFDNDKENFLIKFLEGADISYTVQERKDQVYVGKDKDGKSLYHAKHYLLWTVSDLVGLLNNSDSEGSFAAKFNERVKFSSHYRFIKSVKHLYFSGQIPEVSCLCDKCDNIELLVTGIRTSLSDDEKSFLPCNKYEVAKLFSCDLTD